MNELMCEECSIRPRQSNGTKHGKKQYKKRCVKCTRYPNLKDKAKQTHCSICHKEWLFMQLDVDHINGNRNDSRYRNLQVICANCHRVKSYSRKEIVPKKSRGGK